MSWSDGNVKILREEFVRLAAQPGANIRKLCQQFNISRKTGYKWIKRAHQLPSLDFADQSRRPHRITRRVSEEIKERIIITRCLYPHWGAKKIKAHLLNCAAASHLPAIRTINKILAEEELTRIHQGERHTPYRRFEHPYPNSLWQMDFKGYFSLTDGNNCHPLTIIDDHSRYLICLTACINQDFKTVQPILIKIFSRYGLPDAIALDHGACWKPKSRQQW